ncbi:sulfatase [Fulvivirgaceae bacterium BMA12]|uniref:Sulfatase n=1 Tax=Agaribacillus aureus TaxID=3051825 RepID=A0ABT8L9C6_9BACT|nr:sulfatase [Fulvivirgaceae bacterium BMA12]
MTYINHRHLVIFFCILIFSSACKKRPVQKDRPNLLIIHTDEHNFRTLGCYRKTLPADQGFVWGENIEVETPNIDFIADNGALCTSYYAATPVCAPSRASLMSGRYPQNTSVVTNDIPMDDKIVTFAELLRRQGYESGYAGKWHLDGTGKPQWAPARKFGFSDNRYMFNRGHWKQLEDTEQGPRVASRGSNDQPDYSIKGADERNFTTDFLTRKIIDFITKKRSNPFCFMVSYPDPHGPNTVRAPYDTMFDHLDFQKPKTAFKDTVGLPEWAEVSKKTINSHQMARYFGMVKCLDDNVGKILDALRQTDQLENTIIVFTSDHGDLCGEHGKDNKGNPLEASAKIPFLLHYPGKVKEGLIINQALSTVDFLPTILSLMDVPTANKEQGRDASELFASGAVAPEWKDVIFLRGTGSRDNKPDINWLAAVTDRYKLVFSPKDKPWLFDLVEDPHELENHFENPKYKNTISELAKSIIEYGEKYDDPRIHMTKFREELEEALNQ